MEGAADRTARRGDAAVSGAWALFVLGVKFALAAVTLIAGVVCGMVIVWVVGMAVPAILGIIVDTLTGKLSDGPRHLP